MKNTHKSAIKRFKREGVFFFSFYICQYKQNIKISKILKQAFNCTKNDKLNLDFRTAFSSINFTAYLVIRRLYVKLYLVFIVHIVD